MKQIAENLWLKSYPLSVLGTDHGRNVTFIRLPDDRLVIHSMAPFSPADLEEIRSLGQPAWLVESMLLHDTYAKDGHDLFPGLPFLGPPGFSEIVKFPTEPLHPAPADWENQIEVIPLAGIQKLKEIPVIHIPSRTLILADLIFNFPPHEKGWNRFFHRHIAGFKRYPGMSRVFRIFIDDKAAFRQSIDELLTRDFDRIIVGHGNLIETNGKSLLVRALRDAGVY